VIPCRAAMTAARTLTVALGVLLLLSFAGSAPGASGRTLPGIHVSGKRLVDSKGRTVHWHGVNRSGSEYACIQGYGIFDGPSDAASVKAMATWKINAVRVPINEDCWLGINGVKPAYGGARYRAAIVRYVNLLHRYGMYAELSLMWAAPGTTRATYQPAGPDADHSPALWKSLAHTFRKDSRVVLAPWGETIVDANCFLKGGCQQSFNPSVRYRIAGMQQAVTVMRKAGYRGAISIPGINYANDLSQWLSHKPRDPRRQLIAEAHIYGKNTCSTTSCFDRTLAPVARKVPLIFGETGETYDGSSCASSHIATFMKWVDAHATGYLAWTWDTWGNCSSLISSYGSGAPANAYASFVRQHYLGTR
jgi:endoglucanase